MKANNSETANSFFKKDNSVMIDLLYQKDNLDHYITEEYILRLGYMWLLEYIKHETEYNDLKEFLSWYNSGDVDKIINSLNDNGVTYTLEKTGRYCDIDDLM